MVNTMFYEAVPQWCGFYVEFHHIIYLIGGEFREGRLNLVVMNV